VGKFFINFPKNSTIPFTQKTQKIHFIQSKNTHRYDHADFNNLTAAHHVRPDKFILASEACNGDNWWEHQPFPGDWHRGRLYGFDIVNNLRNWVVGWTDWNLCE
jgi:glucosylceramidase